MRRRLRAGAAILTAAVLSAAYTAAADRTAAVPAKPDDKTIVHVLNRLGFGPSAASRARVQQIGLAAYIDEQLHPEKIPDAGMAARISTFTTLNKRTRDLASEYFLPAIMERRAEQRRANPEMPASDEPPAPATPAPPTAEQKANQRLQRAPIAELSQQKILRAAYSDRQLEEVLVDFWFNHFNVFVGKGTVRLYLTEYERDVIRPHVLGKFRDLLGATAESPAMLFYLDNWQSAAPPGATTSASVDDQRRRADASMRRNPLAPSNPIAAERRRQRLQQLAAARPAPAKPQRRGLNENYARELMELHTLGVDGGYTQQDVQEVARAFTGWTIENPRLGGSFRFDPRIHDDGEKVVLGHRIKAGGGRKDGEQVLDLLARHPSTARHIATKLARRFVSDVPPPALVARAAARFKETDGDIREVVRTIITSPEFFAAGAYRAKTKSPLEFVVSSVRATGVDAANALPLVQAVRDLGMPLYGAQPPTGYIDRADTWVNSGALLNRMNFALALTGNRLRLGSQPAPAMTTTEEASRTFVAGALAGDVSPGTSETVARATTAPQATALLLGSPEFQKR